MPDALAVLALALLGGLVALDATSVGQAMVSRPFVAATLGGLLAGAPEEGIMVGVVLEALHLAVLPVGAAKYPEGGPPALAAGAVFAGMTSHSDAALLLVVMVALAWEWFGGLTVERLRHFNARFAGVPPEGATVATVGRRVAAAVALDFARGALVALAAAGSLAWLVSAVELSVFPPAWARTVIAMSVVAGAASALRLFGRSRWPLFAAGAAAAFLLFLL